MANQQLRKQRGAMRDFSQDGSDTERAALVAEIFESFRDVTRTGGVSWSESAVIDHYGSDEARAIARLADRGTHWSELVNDHRWQPGPGGTVGGVVFLDPIGFRYYLPALMIRCIRDLGDIGGISNYLRAPDELKLANEPLLSERQCRCVARFLWYMSRQSGAMCVWPDPLERYWAELL